MRETDEHAAWTDAFHDSQRTLHPQPVEEVGWYATAGGIAAGLVLLWLLYT